MNAWEWLDVAFCSRLALTLLHCLWQATIIATVAILATRLWRGSTAQMRYMVHICALLAMVACLPVTYLLLTTASPDDGELVVVQEPSETIVIVADLTAESKERSGHEIPLAGSSEALTGSTNVDLPFQQPVTEAADASTGELVQSTNRDAVAAPESGRLQRARAFAPYAALVYAVGVAAMLLRLFVALWAGQRLRGRAEPVTEAKLLGLVRQQAQRLGLRAAPAIYYCGRVTAPVVIGVLRPIILLPYAIATGLSVDQIQAVLTHELAHVRRLDPLINLFQRVAESLLFFHPAAWYISRRASCERENCCDDMVLAMGLPRLDYAEMLLRVAEIGSDASGSTAPHVVALAATGNRPSQLRQRILRLLSGDAEGVRLTQRGAVALTALLFAALLTPLYMFSAHANHAENGQDNTTDSATVESTSDQDVEKESKSVAKQVEQYSYRVGVSPNIHPPVIEWSQVLSLKSTPTKSDFRNGHYVKIWLDENVLHHHWQFSSGNIIGFSSKFRESNYRSPTCISVKDSQTMPKNSGKLYFQIVQWHGGPYTFRKFDVNGWLKDAVKLPEEVPPRRVQFTVVKKAAKTNANNARHRGFDDLADLMPAIESRLPGGWSIAGITFGQMGIPGWKPGAGIAVLIRNDLAPAVLGKRAPWVDTHLFIMNPEYRSTKPIVDKPYARAAGRFRTWRGHPVLIWGDGWEHRNDDLNAAFAAADKPVADGLTSLVSDGLRDTSPIVAGVERHLPPRWKLERASYGNKSPFNLATGHGFEFFYRYQPTKPLHQIDKESAYGEVHFWLMEPDYRPDKPKKSKVATAEKLGTTRGGWQLFAYGFGRKEGSWSNWKRQLRALLSPIDKPVPDGLVKSETLFKEYPILLGNAVTARLKTGNKMPKGWRTKEFLPQITEQLLEIDPNLFRATPEQEKQFADGKFDDKKTGKRIDATIKQLSKLKVVLPWMSQYLLDQYQTGKVSGARLELTARMLNLNVIQTKKDQEKPKTPVAPPNDPSKPFVISIVPRQRKWKTTDTLVFDVVFYNNSSKFVVVDPFWKRFIECDGKLYMDFSIPKPLNLSSLVSHKPMSNVKWTLKINGPFKVMDAKNGKEPLVLAAGEHQLVLIQGEHRSNSVSFTLEDVSLKAQPDATPDDKPTGDMKKEQAKKFTNSIGMKLVKIPAGKFLMGSPKSEKRRQNDEQQHDVRLSKSFYLATTEVTQGQWKSVMKTTPWKLTKEAWKYGPPGAIPKFVREGDDYVANYVGWEDAAEYCRLLSKKDGRKYRLPTEAEWEYACRAGSTKAYRFGADASEFSEKTLLMWARNTPTRSAKNVLTPGVCTTCTATCRSGVRIGMTRNTTLSRPVSIPAAPRPAPTVLCGAGRGAIPLTHWDLVLRPAAG